MSNDSNAKHTEKDKSLHKCDMCSLSYSSEKDLREHFWSLMHHVNIEQKKKNSLHNCTLCFTACSNLAEYRRHLNGEKHKRALEDSRRADEDREMGEASKSHHQSKHSKATRATVDVQDGNHNLPKDKLPEEEQEELESGGYTRDPIFYKKKKNQPPSDIQPQTNLDKRLPRCDESYFYYDGPYDHFGNPWDQGYGYDGCFSGNMFDDRYCQNDYQRGYGRQNFPPFNNGYGWYPPRRGFGGFRRPPRGGKHNQGYVDYRSDNQEDNSDAGGEGEEEYRNWGSSEVHGDNWRNKHPTEGKSGPWSSWRGKNKQRKNSFGDSEGSLINDGKRFGGKKNKKKKKTKGNKSRDTSVHSDSPETNHARKRCRDFDVDSVASKASKMTSASQNVKSASSFQFDKLFSSDHEADTLSSSVRSTSSNRSKSSNKSRSSSNSPSLRLKTFSARKLQSTRISPKGFHISPKYKWVRKELGESKDHSESGVLEKAEKLCKELREKRQKAKHDNEKKLKSKKNEHRDFLNKALKSLNEINKSKIKGHLTSVEKGLHTSSSDMSTRGESGIATFSSSQTSANLAESGKSDTSSTCTLVSHGESHTTAPTPVFRSDIDRIRHTIESSVKKSHSSPAKTSSSAESPGAAINPKSKKPLSKDSLLKMVNSPRSRNERMQLARILRSHTKSVNKLAPSRLNVQLNGLYDNYEFDEEDIPAISLEDLSPEVKLQIAQLIEDEVNTDSMEMLSPQPVADSRISFPKPSGSKKLEAMEAVAGYVSVSNKLETDAGDDALQLEDLINPGTAVGTDAEEIPNTDSLDTGQATEPIVTVTSVNGVPQLHVSEPTFSSNSRSFPATSPDPQSSPAAMETSDQTNSRSTAVSIAVDLGRRAMQMSSLERFSPIRTSTANTNQPSSSQSPTSGPRGLHTLLELTLKEEEKHREMEELDQRMDVMRQMVRRTLEHLEKNEHRKRELCNETKKLRDERLKILKDITGHPSLMSPQHTTQPSFPAPEHLTNHIRQSSESMDMDLVTDTVSSTSQARQDTALRTDISQSELVPIASSISRPDSRPDFATRPVSTPTVSAPCSSFDKEVATNPLHSQPSSQDDQAASSFALSCVTIKQERFTPSPDASTPITSCTSLAEDGDGTSKLVKSVASNSNDKESMGQVPSSSSFVRFSTSSIPTIAENPPIASSDALASESTPIVILSSPNTPSKSTSVFKAAPTTTSGEDRFTSLTSWSPLADRLMSVSGSSQKRTKSVDASANPVNQTIKTQNQKPPSWSALSTDSAIRSILQSPPLNETSENVLFEKSITDSNSSGLYSVSSLPKRTEVENTPVKTSEVLRSVRTRTISDSSDGDQNKKSSNLPMTYLGSISGDVGTAAVLKKLAADLGSLGNTMSCVMLDKQDILTDKFPSISLRTRNNSESSIKSVGHSDIQLMELDLKNDLSGKDSTPREESDQSGSVASNSSLGEKIRRYCQATNQKTSLDTIEGGCSDLDRTLREEEVTRAESPESDNTPGRILKHCSVVLQKLELEKKGENPQEGEETQEMADHQEVVKDVLNLEQPEQLDLCSRDSFKLLMSGPVSPGKKRRKTKKERDILASRRSYWFDSSSDNNSQEDESVPKLSSLKQQLVFNQKEDNSSEVEQEASAKNGDSVAIICKKEIGSLEDRIPAEVNQKSVEEIRNAQTDPLLLRLQAEEVDTSQTACRTPVLPTVRSKNSSSGVTYTGPSDTVSSMQVFNNYLYVCYQGKDIRRFHLQSGELGLVYNCSYHSVQCMSVVSGSGKEDCIYAGGLSFHLIVFNVKNPQIVHTFELSEEIKCMHHDSGFIYVGLVSGSVEVFDVKNHRHKDSFQCAYQAIHCISSAREGGSKLICVSAQDTTISVCDARSGLPVRILGGHSKTSFSVMSSDHFVFSGSGDRTVMMHNLHTGKLEWTFKGHNGIVTSVWVEGNSLYSAGYDRLVRCFDIKNRSLKRMFYGAGKGVITSMTVCCGKLYTGNREGLVESVNMKSESWSCQFESCQYVFGLKEHLLHHLLTDHINSTGKMTKCLWKDCTDWLTLHRDDGAVETHMKKHIENLNVIL